MSRVVKLFKLHRSTGRALILLLAIASVVRFEHALNSGGKYSSLFSHTLRVTRAEQPLMWLSRYCI